MKVKPDLSFWKLWNISFGFFGVQIAYALQSANISRIFSTLGADPHNLSYFWILPPLAGIIVQPIVGAASDKTWTRFGRRIPYLFIGSLVAVLVMCLLPNAGSFGMAVSTAMIFGLVSLMFLDTSINMAMQPFKMMVGDMVNEKQKGLAYSIQSFLCNAGSLVGYLFPFIFAWIGISNTAPQGVIPDSVIYSFYIGAAILIFCVIYTSVKVKEMPPAEYAEYHGITEEEDIGFISTYFIHSPYMLFISFLLIGCAWAAMLALPFTILTNALSGGHMGTYLGLFNGTICIPQIIAAALGGTILALFTPKGALPPEINMLVLAGVMLIIGALCVYLIKETKGEKAD